MGFFFVKARGGIIFLRKKNKKRMDGREPEKGAPSGLTDTQHMCILNDKEMLNKEAELLKGVSYE